MLAPDQAVVAVGGDPAPAAAAADRLAAPVARFERVGACVAGEAVVAGVPTQLITPASGDEGVDVYVVRNDDPGRTLWVVQAKRYAAIAFRRTGRSGQAACRGCGRGGGGDRPVLPVARGSLAVFGRWGMASWGALDSRTHR